MISEAMMGVNAFKAALDIAKGLKDIDDRTRRNEAVIELQEKIVGAQAAQAAVVQQVSELEKEVTSLKTWDADKQRYKLVEMRPGVLAYTPKEGMENDEPAHHLCTSCYQSGLKSILVSATWNPGRCHVLICNDCGWYAYLQGMAIPEHISGQSLIAAPERTLFCFDWLYLPLLVRSSFYLATACLTPS